MKRNLSLDILKIFACVAVISLHVTGVIIFHNLNNKFTIAHFIYYASVYAIPVFFMVNGYIMLNKSIINYKYIYKKILNILLVVFSWNVLYCAGYFVLKHQLINPLYYTYGSLFLMKTFFTQFWFFGSLIIMYLCLPILHKSFNYSDKKSIFLTLTAVIFCFAIDLINILFANFQKSIFEINVIQPLRIWTWLAYYLLGGLLGKKNITVKVISAISLKINIILTFIMTIIVVAYQYNIGKLLYHSQSGEFFYVNAFVFIWSLSIMILMLRLEIKDSWIIKLLQENIIGIYIIHGVVISVIFKFMPIVKSNPYINISSIFLVFLCSLFVSFIIQKIPIIKRIVSV
jgi:surface polysaccharide O-acyltransferase-like enzyme